MVLIAKMRSEDVHRLLFTPNDLIRDLPGPDQSGNLLKIAKAVAGNVNATVSELYNKWQVLPPPEMISCLACLELGKGRGSEHGTRVLSNIGGDDRASASTTPTPTTA